MQQDNRKQPKPITSAMEGMDRLDPHPAEEGDPYNARQRVVKPGESAPKPARDRAASALADGVKPGPKDSKVQILPAGPEGMRNDVKRPWKPEDEASDESFPQAIRPQETNSIEPAMRFYFHLRDGQTFVPDEEGVVLANMAEARQEAVRSARDILADQLRAGKALDGQVIEISDGEGKVLDTLAFKDALRPDGTIH